MKNQLNLPHQTAYTESCKSVHAEMNAIISASRERMIDSTLYLYGYDIETSDCVKDCYPCKICERLIINAGIKNVITRDSDNQIHVYDVNSFCLDKDKKEN